MSAAVSYRVLMLNMEKGWRGGERQTLLMMQYLRDAGHTVTLVARREQPLAARARADGFDVLACGNHGHLVLALLRHRQADIFHAQTANVLTWLALLKPVLKGRIIFTRRTAFPVRKRPRLTRWKWRRADALVAISDAAAAEPLRLGIKVAATIPSAVNFQPSDPTRLRRLREHFQVEGRHVVATVAALTTEKDPVTLVRTVHQLRQLRDDFIFLHFGADGDQAAQAAAWVKTLNLESHFRFVGFREDITDCYRLMDVFVLTSIHEALGSSVLDAFLYGVPVVATKAGGLPALLADGRGLTASVGDYQALAASIHGLLQHPDQAQSMAAKALAYVNGQHGPARMIEHYLAVYRSVLSGCSR